MRAYNPDMPLVAVFRDPLERLFSHWVMLRSRNLAWPDWPDFLTEWPHTSLPDEVPDDVRTMRWRHMTGLARGFYGEQLQRGFELFDRQQWLLLELRAMLGDFDATVDRTTDFLDLPRFERVPPLKNWHAGAEQVPGTAPTADDLARVAEVYAKDLALFEELSGHRHLGLADPAHPRRAGSTPASWPRGWRGRSADAVPSRSGAGEEVRRPPVVHRLLADVAAGSRGVDDLAVADVEGDVVDRARVARRAPEDEVAGCQLAAVILVDWVYCATE